MATFSFQTKIESFISYPTMSTDSTINPHNGNPYSKEYYKILETRKSLPVWERREEFLKNFKENQIIILQGETGSGKTTQVRILVNIYRSLT